MTYSDATIAEVEQLMEESWRAFQTYRNHSLASRATFMYAIADEVEALGDALLQVAGEETNLPEARLRNERARTVFQLKSYADACRRGDWLEARIDTSDTDRNPPKPDLRKMLVPLGPVVVFGSSNFPFAYSTAGGDTACAFAAGCSVVVKAHPAHPHTSAMVADAISRAVKKCGLPTGLFTHVYGASFEIGKSLVMHRRAKAVGFTGSFRGGKTLFDWANQREEPIPVFAEMGSVNPVFVLPEKLERGVAEIAKMYAGSITLGVGQFCTNPGLLLAIESEALDEFVQLLSEEVRKVSPAKMLHAGIAKSYSEKRALALQQEGVDLMGNRGNSSEEGLPTIATATATAFLKNPVLQEEVFGPYSLVIKCRDQQEMLQVATNIKGQLTTTVMATENDVKGFSSVLDAVKSLCGRLIYNGVPTGVEVCLSMQHGGPFPATTDSRFTSVGADGIRRFARPLAYQNWPNELLPDELKNGNPLGIWRTVNNELNKSGW